MKEYKLGERVAFYNGGRRMLGVIKDIRLADIIIEETSEYHGLYRVHPKQIRKLKPGKPKRREFWVSDIATGIFSGATKWRCAREVAPENKEGWIKVREVRE